MLCTPRGQVMLLDGARSVYDLNRELDQKLGQQRREFWEKTPPADALAEVRRITGIRKLADLPEMKGTRTESVQRDGYRIDTLVLESEPGVRLSALALVPDKPSGEAYLYLRADGKLPMEAGDPIPKWLAAGHVVLAVGLRGLPAATEAKSGGPSIPLSIGSDWKDLYLASLLGTSYLAMRAEDVLNSARFAAGYEAGEHRRPVHLVSLGRVGPAALHAAALEPDLFASVTISGCLASWRHVLDTPLAVQQFETVVHGALKCYDLPNLLNSLPQDKVRWSEPMDALGFGVQEVERNSFRSGGMKVRGSGFRKVSLAGAGSAARLSTYRRDTDRIADPRSHRKTLPDAPAAPSALGPTAAGRKG
jgi:hypothetical protein